MILDTARIDYSVGSVPYVVTAAFYSITEAGFRMLFSRLIFLLLAIVTSRRISAAPGEVDSACPRGLIGTMWN